MIEYMTAMVELPRYVALGGVFAVIFLTWIVMYANVVIFQLRKRNRRESPQTQSPDTDRESPVFH